MAVATKAPKYDVTDVAMPRSRYAMRVRTFPTAAMFERRERTCVPAADTSVVPMYTPK